MVSCQRKGIYDSLYIVKYFSQILVNDGNNLKYDFDLSK